MRSVGTPQRRLQCTQASRADSRPVWSADHRSGDGLRRKRAAPGNGALLARQFVQAVAGVTELALADQLVSDAVAAERRIREAKAETESVLSTLHCAANAEVASAIRSWNP